MKSTVPVKNDLNLMPRREGPSAFLKIGLPLISFAIILAAALTVGILIPESWKAERIARRNAINEEIAALSNVQQEFQLLSLELAELNARVGSFESFSASEIKLKDMLELIEENCPESVEISTADFNYEKISLSGVCFTDQEVASFAVKLRSTGKFSEINIEIVQPNTSEIIRQNVNVTDQQNPETESETETEAESRRERAFHIELFYPIKDLLPAAAAGSNSVEGGV